MSLYPYTLCMLQRTEEVLVTSCKQIVYHANTVIREMNSNLLSHSLLHTQNEGLKLFNLTKLKSYSAIAVRLPVKL